MVSVMDPRIAAIMAQYDMPREEDKPQEAVQEEKKKPKPPTNYEEFMNAEGLEEWPQRLTSEGALDISDEAFLLGSQEDIAAILRESAPLGLHMLEDLEGRLDKLEDKLRFYADQVVTEEKKLQREEDIPYGVSRAFITQMAESDAVKSHHSARGRRTMDLVETMMETRKKSMDYCQFPGFRHGELIELPAQLESPPILHRVTKAQNFNPGFKKFWKKLFLSEASVAVMQDTFWWFFLNRFDRNSEDEKNLLYDRIADSFVGLFASIHKDVKDKFLSVYPDCLAQAIYMAYWTAFPESHAKMDESFKQDLLNVVHEWVTGLKPVPGTWKTWNIQKMEAKAPKGLERESNQATTKLMQAAALNKEMNLSLDMDSFNRMMASLGGNHTGPPSSVSPTPQNVSREMTKLTTMTNFTNMTNGLSIASHNFNVPPTALSQGSTSRLATCGTTSHRVEKKESHQLGPGPEYERVLFNTSGRSPLISHYLHLRQLRDFKQPGKKVRRTEISAMPPPGPTYKQLIETRKAMSEALKKEYEKICDQTHKDIVEIERKRIKTNREISNITRELMMTKNPLDIKILSERIMAIRNMKVVEERDRDMSLLDKDSDAGPLDSGPGLEEEEE
ncbi:protein FAM227B-like isoform X2 [Saccostrea echinata]|uniref:protein FAM227B-like isoform X2 n=1 Tax=Saccostrea echinata TaxID=191078 RepID=UPI002A81A60E|nr:protein FAM227B-like isoform X2 [Saccostrea echinata]